MATAADREAAGAYAAIQRNREKLYQEVSAKLDKDTKSKLNDAFEVVDALVDAYNFDFANKDPLEVNSELKNLDPPTS